eukprot:Gb_40026 [translate_table: standard]
MFVFGDSYADTGNQNSTMNSWKPPYGTTFPGKPAGRYSDGRLLTDFVASYFKIPSPVPYKHRNYDPNLVPFGMNFAYGGTGVFDTGIGLPNATTQIDQLQRLIEDGVYSAQNLTSSLVLFSVAGNDYGYYLLRKGSHEGIYSFEKSVVRQISVDLLRLYRMGFRMFAVSGLQPLGCLPSSTVRYSYQYCNQTSNNLVLLHNSLLEKAVLKIKKTLPDASLVILDQYTSFMSILTRPNQYGAFEEPVLKPCCIGKTKLDYCGSVDEEGKALYSVCANPESAFFWDEVHPSQAAWQALIGLLSPSLHSFWHSFNPPLYL